MRVRLTLAGLLLASACSLAVSLDDLGAPDASNEGAEGGPCYANGTCNAGLACVLVGGTGRCEAPDDAAGAPDGAAADAPVPPTDAKSDAFFAVGCTPQPDLLAYYVFEETTGPTVHDCVSASNDGTISSAASSMFTDGYHGSGLWLEALDGGCSHVDFFTPTFDFGGNPAPPFTVALWISFHVAPATGDIAYVVGKSSNIAAAGWRLAIDSNGGVTFSVPNGSGGTVTANGPTAMGLAAWHHLAAVYDSALVVYLDGVPGNPTTAGAGFAPDDANADHLRLGCSADDQHPTQATFDELRFYDRALSAAEVQTLVAL